MKKEETLNNGIFPTETEIHSDLEKLLCSDLKNENSVTVDFWVEIYKAAFLKGNRTKTNLSFSDENIIRNASKFDPLSVMDVSECEWEDIKNQWIQSFKESSYPFPFSAFIKAQNIINRINDFVDGFEEKGIKISSDLDLTISDEYYNALNNLIIDGKFRSLNVKTVEMMQPDRMFISSSQKTN